MHQALQLYVNSKVTQNLRQLFLGIKANLTIHRIPAIMVLCCWHVLCVFPAMAEPLTENRPIIVGGIISHPPFEFLDQEGKFTGYGVELTRAIAKTMGMNLQFTIEPFGSIRRSLYNGKIDVLMDIAYSESRAKYFDFSPHTIVVFSIFGRKGALPISPSETLKGKDIMALKGNVISDLAIEQGWNDSLTLFDTDEQILRLLDSGMHEYAILPKDVAAYLIKKLGLKNVVYIAETQNAFNYSFAVRKGNQELLQQFTQGLAILHKTGQYKKIHDKWLGDGLKPHREAWLQTIKIAGSLTALYLVILSVVFIWSRTLKSKVAQRTAALAQEVKERQRAEDELRRNQEQLIQTSKMAAIGTLVSGVAHEINNPNGLVLLNVTMLSEMNETIRHITEEWYKKNGDFAIGKWQYSQIRENLWYLPAETLEASKRIGRIVNDLKNFSRSTIPQQDEVVDLNSVAKTAIRLVDTSIKQATDSFVAHYAEDLPKIRGNSQRIEQVIVNLIMNACQALSSQDESIVLRTGYNESERVVELQVSDAGVGIAPEQLQYITDPFYTTKRELGGTGLGLSVSSTIAKEHGGVLTIDSTLGKGTTVTLVLPAAANGALA
ncbi:transporter substrate-binding domain-containing protein [Oryzomonas sagensis]|uniref:histidine kinase n=1 Tax=Oryzomonas sagensis TaxID=2603857 RepID=A0ABQ6TKZ8_9BACT|nr:transporter substrate-binding domain-containing protein [Oryzomonas sagensis]KAB0668842.1 transporter substrate-binding domain-containing protein [Oryzomonas sagensis]